MNALTPAPSCEYQRARTLTSMEKCLVTANKRRYMAILWKAEAGEPAEPRLDDPFDAAGKLTDTMLGEAAAQAWAAFQIKKNHELGVVPGTATNVANAVTASTARGHADFVALLTVAATAGAGAVPANRCAVQYKDCVRLMNTAVSRADMYRWLAVMWTKERGQRPSLTWQTAVIPRHVTPQGGRNLVNPRQVALGQFQAQKSDIVAGVPVGIAWPEPAWPPDGAHEYT